MRSPFILDTVPLNSWSLSSPDDLILNPGAVSKSSAIMAAAQALKYSRLIPGASYDEIGFRFVAATSVRGPLPLSTMPWMHHLERVANMAQTDNALPDIAAQQDYLRHRPIDLPNEEATVHYRFEVRGKMIHMIRSRPQSKTTGAEETWVFPLTHPPQLLLQNSVDRDEVLLLSQMYKANLPGAFWIPLMSIVESGRIRRMQDWRGQLKTQTDPANFYCFVSHRWLTPAHPDPEGSQARFIAWQLFAHLCDAVRVAHARGLSKPRRFSPIGFAVGPSGSDLAEALLVNVLRLALDDDTLILAQREASGCEESVHDYGIAAAQKDLDLVQLRGILRAAPTLSELLRRVFVWYDFGSMPQLPRTSEEEDLFQAAIENLSALQLFSRTAILLDETEDYLSRGWCTLESVVADSSTGVKDLLVGSRRSTQKDGNVEHHFDMLLEDRPHLVWRAVLDAEVFRIQTPEECLERLRLAVTEPGDIPFIYEGLVRLNAPRKIHIDASEVVTGVFPLPVSGRAALIATDSGRVVNSSTIGRVLNLDWSGACSIRKNWEHADKPEDYPAWLPISKPTTSRRCHVAVVASCEGEAVVMTRWIKNALTELELLIGVTVDSISWLSSDVAPVGHLLEGSLQAVAIKAEVWVLAAMSARFTNCSTTSTLQKSIAASNATYFELRLDAQERNLEERLRVTTGGENQIIQETHSVRGLNLATLAPRPYLGGLYREDVLEILSADERSTR